MARVLIVDDNRIDRHQIRRVLRGLQHEFVEANDGRDAIDKMQDTAPDLVVTDLKMPVVNGLELVSISRKRYPSVPVVLITSHGNETLAKEALRLGAVSYVPKDALEHHLPMTVERLLELIGAQSSQRQLLRRLLKSQFVFELENETTYLPSLIRFLQDSLHQIGTCSPADVTRVSVALDEAITNAIFHGNLELNSDLRSEDELQFYELAKKRQNESPYKDRRIRVDVELQPEEAKFVITDEGPGFDLNQLPELIGNSNLDKLTGRGVMLMQMFMDEVSYNDVGNSVTLIKRRSQDGQT